MKNQWTLGLVALALVCALTGCGSRKEPANNNNTTNNGSASVTTPDNGNGNHSVMDDVENGIADTGEAIGNGMDNVGDALTGGNHNNNTSAQNDAAKSGVTYDEMLNNGNVHDTDGVLTDGENAASKR